VPSPPASTTARFTGELLLVSGWREAYGEDPIYRFPATLNRVPASWIWLQRAIVIMVLIGAVIAIVKLV
jgi:hypothetical protein